MQKIAEFVRSVPKPGALLGAARSLPNTSREGSPSGKLGYVTRAVLS